MGNPDSAVGYAGYLDPFDLALKEDQKIVGVFLEQTIQIIGALLIVVAYGLSQFRHLSQHSIWYLLANLVGSAVLAVLALLDSLWGFFLLEAVWALVSAIGLVRKARNSSL